MDRIGYQTTIAKGADGYRMSNENIESTEGYRIAKSSDIYISDIERETPKVLMNIGYRTRTEIETMSPDGNTA